ncbi:hypothetical protein P691DRAFT_838562 [Macrolepiota fuliginosa MF-IS2]|uniref:Zn(2)-C6 fungal-type domain-containing protein n=1 Tax=Macrolepiota fuliginosa MF-IS2 TaxID=1400762 RepID=A0A9P6C7T0_9AGAR|nr:hypothetical protein P691DRAFT_838562 [Macrolepiota fuliginosa MF-IS2]
MPYPNSHSYDDSFGPKDSSSNPFMFTSQQHPQQPLYPTSTHDSPQGWPPYDQTLLPPFQSQPLPYRGFPTPAPYPASRLSSPHNIAGGGHTATTVSRLSLAGSLDPATGIFYRTPEHPRLRTAQACEKCRTRKAKCSGEHPSCKRCINRGLVCEYAKEGRVRGPNKVKNATSMGNPSLKNIGTPAAADLEQRGRTSSANSSGSSIDQAGPSAYVDDRSKIREQNPEGSPGSSPVSPSLIRLDTRVRSPHRMNFGPVSQHRSSLTTSLSQELYSMSSSTASSGQSSRRNSLTAAGAGLGEHRASRPRPPNLGLDNNWRQDAVDAGNDHAGWMGQPNDVLGLSSLTADLGMDPQYERQRLAQQQQQQRYLLEQRRIALQHRVVQQPNMPSGLDYHQAQALQQPAPFSTIPTQQHHNSNPGSDVYQSNYHVYSPGGDYVHQQGVDYANGMHALQNQGYREQHIPSVMGHMGSYQRVSMEVDTTEQGLHPSLSRIEKRAEFLDGEAREEDALGGCPSSVNRGPGGLGDGDRARWV